MCMNVQEINWYANKMLGSSSQTFQIKIPYLEN